MTSRAALSGAFLQRSGWADADRAFLAADSSVRRYDRLRLADKTAVLMDAPPPNAEDPQVFLNIASYLQKCGLSAPGCLAQDLQNGFLLLEDLGEGLFARLVTDDPPAEFRLYQMATDVLAHLQRHAPPPDLPDLSAEDWAEAACFVLDWYRFAIVGDHVETSGLRRSIAESLRRYADGPRVMILRDYHAENLLWLPDRVGLAQVGLLDFQLAQMGQPGYDLVSLLQDARRDVSSSVEAAMIEHFISIGGHDPAGFRAAYAVLGAQRALRIIGIFSRLCLKDGKPDYLKMIPRVWDQLWRNLANAELADLAEICANLLPPPSPENLERIGAQCGHFP